MKVQGEGAVLHVDVRGRADAPTVVLLHAFPLHGGMWSPQVDALEDRWRFLVPDVRGFGASEPGDGQYAIDFFVDDLFAELDALASGPVVACGLSMGGYILLRAWEREPERFRGLVLADTRSGADTDAGRLRRLEAIRTVRREGAAAYADAFIPGALGRTTLADRPAVVEDVRGMVGAASVGAIVGAQLAMAARTDTTPALEEMDVPALVVVGEEDELSPRAVAGEMAERIPGARLVVIPRAGHLSNLERPEAFTTALAAFLEQMGPVA